MGNAMGCDEKVVCCNNGCCNRMCWTIVTIIFALLGIIFIVVGVVFLTGCGSARTSCNTACASASDRPAGLFGDLSTTCPTSGCFDMSCDDFQTTFGKPRTAKCRDAQ